MTLHLAKSSVRSILLVGDYGSGKSEVAVNLALRLAAEMAESGDPRRAAIADLDLVNPYFRCREARAPLEEAGIRVVMPGDGHQFADLPILLPQVKGLLQDEQTRSILDVGGDEVGARVLASLASFVVPSRTDFWFVLNRSRPFNDTLEGCERTISRVEAAAGMRVTGLVSNTHLMDETTSEMVLEGLRLAEEVAAARGVPVVLVTAMEPIAEKLPRELIAHPLLPLRRLLVPPWLRPERPSHTTPVTRDPFRARGST
jgi:hypothetical protein